MLLLQKHLKKKKLFLPGIEPGTLSVLDSRDNHYTTRTAQHNVKHLRNKSTKLVNC